MQRRRLQQLCAVAVVAYFLIILALLYSRGLISSNATWATSSVASDAATTQPAVAASVRPADSAAAASGGQLCLPARTPRPLLVEMPFTAADVPSLDILISLWEHHWPCYQPPLQPSRPDLVLGFNGNLSEPAHARLRSRLTSLITRRVVRECFGRVSLESAYLSGVDDTYDKQRLNANWTVGPNNLFFHFLHASSSRGEAASLGRFPGRFPRPRPLSSRDHACPPRRGHMCENEC